MNKSVFVSLVAVLHTGCAAKPELIAAIPVSSARYSDMTCAELVTEMEIVANRLAVLSERQRAARTRDGWLNVLVLPGLGAATPNQEGAIGQTKGEQDAIQREHASRCSGNENS